jgi:hypothetical protein
MHRATTAAAYEAGYVTAPNPWSPVSSRRTSSTTMPRSAPGIRRSARICRNRSLGTAVRPSRDTARELRIGREGALFDGDDGARRPWRGRRRGRPLDDQRRVPPGRERLQREALLAIKADARPLARGAVQAHIGHRLKPVLPLLLEVAVIDEGAPVDEIAAPQKTRAAELEENSGLGGG